MIADDLDRILATEEPIEPSPGFAAAVLHQVREAAAAPPHLTFPWLRFLAGVSGMSVLAGLCGWFLATSSLPAALAAALTHTLAVLTDPHASIALGTVAVSLAGTYLLFWVTQGVAGMRR